ncbi:MAG: hypothetical protein CR975_01290 [Gammaproteobacteria bacterium]|nr:MAG: hypothetical protein CR975_01290 [Gammaproteobacteria bacterium]
MKKISLILAISTLYLAGCGAGSSGSAHNSLGSMDFYHNNPQIKDGKIAGIHHVDDNKRSHLINKYTDSNNNLKFIMVSENTQESYEPRKQDIYRNLSEMIKINPDTGYTKIYLEGHDIDLMKEGDFVKIIKDSNGNPLFNIFEKGDSKFMYITEKGAYTKNLPISGKFTYKGEVNSFDKDGKFQATNPIVLNFDDKKLITHIGGKKYTGEIQADTFSASTGGGTWINGNEVTRERGYLNGGFIGKNAEKLIGAYTHIKSIKNPQTTTTIEENGFFKANKQ